MNAMYMECMLKFTYLWEHAVLLTFLEVSQRCVGGGRFLILSGICICTSLNFIKFHCMVACLVLRVVRYHRQ